MGYGRKPPGLLCIEDPLNPSNDVGGGSFGVLKVKNVFKLAFNTLKAALETDQFSPDTRFVLSTQ